MSIFTRYQGRFEAAQEEEMSIQEYLDLCKKDPTAYASVAERMLSAIGEPKLIDTRNDQRLSRIFANKMLRRYPSFGDLYGMEDAIEHIVAYFRHAAQGLEEKKQILYLLGPVGGGKSSLAEKLKYLIERIPIYAIKGSPVHESPLGLFNPIEDATLLQDDYGIAPRYLSTIMSPWAVKRLHEFRGDVTKFRVVKLHPSVLSQIAVAKTEPGDENNQDISSLVGKIDIRKLETYSQDITDPEGVVTAIEYGIRITGNLKVGGDSLHIGGRQLLRYDADKATATINASHIAVIIVVEFDTIISFVNLQREPERSAENRYRIVISFFSPYIHWKQEEYLITIFLFS